MNALSLVTTDVDVAVRKLRAGGLVAVPTETVYGLAADASNLAAVARIFAVKGRPTGHPLIVHIADADQLDAWSSEPSNLARRLATNGWPGPLTLIVPRSDRVHDAVTGGRSTVGLRVPAHPMTLGLLRSSGLAIAAPSANRFGAVSPTTAQHVLDDLGDMLDPATDAILDGGPGSRARSSTPPSIRPNCCEPVRSRPTMSQRSSSTSLMHPGRRGQAGCSNRTMRRSARSAWSTTPTMPGHFALERQARRSSSSTTISLKRPARSTPNCDRPTLAAPRRSSSYCPQPWGWATRSVTA
jgi:tRNA threonylcarbamoyl adenosine modification protein (Sua5/YciO/YrdC/YwlC family)